MSVILALTIILCVKQMNLWRRVFSSPRNCFHYHIGWNDKDSFAGCHVCGAMGHKRRDCPHEYNPAQGQRYAGSLMQALNLCMFTLHSLHIQNDFWINSQCLVEITTEIFGIPHSGYQLSAKSQISGKNEIWIPLKNNPVSYTHLTLPTSWHV